MKYRVIFGRWRDGRSKSDLKETPSTRYWKQMEAKKRQDTKVDDSTEWGIKEAIVRHTHTVLKKKSQNCECEQGMSHYLMETS